VSSGRSSGGAEKKEVERRRAGEAVPRVEHVLEGLCAHQLLLMRVCHQWDPDARQHRRRNVESYAAAQVGKDARVCVRILLDSHSLIFFRPHGALLPLAVVGSARRHRRHIPEEVDWVKHNLAPVCTLYLHGQRPSLVCRREYGNGRALWRCATEDILERRFVLVRGAQLDRRRRGRLDVGHVRVRYERTEVLKGGEKVRVPARRSEPTLSPVRSGRAQNRQRCVEVQAGRVAMQCAVISGAARTPCSDAGSDPNAFTLCSIDVFVVMVLPMHWLS
jgi:hypothetical protein